MILIAAPKKIIKMQLSEESKVSSLAGGWKKTWLIQLQERIGKIIDLSRVAIH